MLALLSHSTGGPETLVLERVAAPTAGPGEAVVEVAACGVNFPDVLMIEDKYQIKPPRPFAPGAEVAGVVRSVGEGVTTVQPGQRVAGLCVYGGMAQAVAIPADQLFVLPDDMPFDEAAAMLLAFGTSLHGLKDRAALAAGETLLVLGAAGGVGLAAVMIGKAIGARVVAAVSSEEKAGLCRQFGADETLIYDSGALDREQQKALAAQFKAVCGPGGANVVYDAIGGDYSEPALRSIAFEGRFLVVGFAAGSIPAVRLNLVLLKGCQIIGVSWGGWFAKHPQAHRANIALLFDYYRQGLVRPFISRRLPLDRGAEAIAMLADRSALGKIVVLVEQGGS